ncbi:MAG: DUF3142 domain-containing protein [Pseudomonadota bacterium]
MSLTSCDNVSQNATPPEAAIVDAADHDAFWLWAGVRPQPVLESAKTVYILDSELRRGDRLPTVLRPAIPAVGDTDIWIVVRVETLDWSEQVHASLQRRLRLWEQRNRLVGLQVDFDAATHGLDEYGAFLGDLRRRLPSRFRLGITGLMDWSANGDPAALAALSDSVDDIVIQTYQGRQTIPGYATYLKHLGRLDIPYRIGLVQHGQWAEPAGLRDDPDFRGYVVFLVNPR